MPSMMMLSDSMFPRFTDESSQGEKIEVIHNYLYQLLEQLRYTLGNLEADNFNESALESLGSDITAELAGEVKVIRHALVGLNGTLDLAMTGDGILTRLESAEGSISQVNITAAELSTRLESAEGSIAEFTATANKIELRVASIEGDIDDIEDEAVEASVAEIQTMAKEISMSVRNRGTSSTITLTAFGTKIVSDAIELTGYVTFSSLEEEGESTINGANITTGTITAIDIESCDIRGSNLYLYMDNNDYDDSMLYLKYGSLTIGEIGIGFDGSTPYMRVSADKNRTVDLILSAAGYVKIDAGGTTWRFEDDGIYASVGNTDYKVVAL